MEAGRESGVRDEVAVPGKSPNDFHSLPRAGTEASVGARRFDISGR
jgi:hypothetical protein